MEIERQTDVRLATWLCQALEDDIYRRNWVMEDSRKNAVADRAHERAAAVAHLADDFWKQQAEREEEDVKECKDDIDALLILVSQAKALKRDIAEYWRKKDEMWKSREAADANIKKGVPN